MKSYRLVTMPCLLAGCLALTACGGGSDGGTSLDPIDDPIEDPVEPLMFFSGAFLETRDAGNAALVGFDLQSQLERAAALVPDGSTDNETDSAVIECADGGSTSVLDFFRTEPNTFINTRNQLLNDCVQDGITFSGLLDVTTEQLGIGATERVTTTRIFNVDIAGINNGEGSLSLSGNLTTVEQREFNTQSECPPAGNDTLAITIDEGGTYDDPVAGFTATFDALEYTRITADRFVLSESGCEVEQFITYTADATGSFSGVSTERVAISKTGSFLESGISENDAAAVFNISALESQSSLTVSATGDTPTAVQVDIVDMEAIQSFADSWDFSN